MNDFSIALQMTAALASAIAAIAAFWVASRAYAFQKNSLLKIAITEQILKLLQQLYHLKRLTNQPVLGAADEDVLGLGPTIAEAKQSARLLEAMVCGGARKNMKNVHDVVHGLHEGSIFPTGQVGPNAPLNKRLDEAIGALQRVYRTEMK